jgi:hypothetical protein
MSQRPSSGMARVSAADKILIGAAVLLLIDSFLPWQRECVASVNPPLTVCLGTRSAWNGDGAFAGVLMGLFAALLILGELAAMSDRPLPVTIPPSTLVGGFTAGTALFGLIKALFVVTHHPKLWAWVGLGLVVAISYGGFMKMHEQRAAPPATGFTG